MKRGGWSLLELLMALTVIAAAITLSGAVFSAVLREAPRVARAVEAGRQVNLALARLQQDIDAAVSLPASKGDLLIELPDGVVGYSAGGGEIVRFVHTVAGRRIDRTWPTPRAQVRWSVWQRAGRRHAVEVRTWVEPKALDGPPVRKLANARVLFLPPARSREGAK